MNKEPSNPQVDENAIRNPGANPFPDDLSGLPGIALQLDNASRAFIARQGAQVLSWHDDQGKERLYLSPLTGGYHRGDAVDQPGQPIRGGIPVSFPQFSDRGPLPKHGFARNMLWELSAGYRQAAVDATRRVISLTLQDCSRTQAIWPHAFRAVLSMALAENQLSVSLQVNNTGSVPWTFTVALHTYLRVEDIRSARLSGLQNVRYQDATAANVESVQQEKELQIAGEVDRVYISPPNQLTLLENGRPSLKIEQEGFADTVVWNPGPAKAQALKDFPDEDWLRMLCVEAACVIHPISLEPGQSWSGRQILTVMSAPA